MCLDCAAESLFAMTVIKVHTLSCLASAIFRFQGVNFLPSHMSAELVASVIVHITVNEVLFEL